jgi:hypothetical protein
MSPLGQKRRFERRPITSDPPDNRSDLSERLRHSKKVAVLLISPDLVRPPRHRKPVKRVGYQSVEQHTMSPQYLRDIVELMIEQQLTRAAVRNSETYRSEQAANAEALGRA